MAKTISNGGAVFARLTFWAALAFTVVLATLPKPPEIIAAPDKVQHALAFFVLTALHKLAYREFGFWKRVIVMAILGGAIEVAQMVPAFHRDAEWMDWVADVAATLAASLTVLVLVPTRSDSELQKDRSV